MHELVVPELEAGVLDELDEGDEKTPGVRPVHDQPLQQHPVGGLMSLRWSMIYVHNVHVHNTHISTEAGWSTAPGAAYVL